jgi:hypothetical protein
VGLIAIGFWLNVKNSSYILLSIRHPDEIAIIDRIFYNPLQFWKGFYGLQYNLWQLLFSVPGLLLDNYQITAIGNRMVPVFFAWIGFVFSHKTLLLIWDSKYTFILVFLLFAIPGFWVNLNIARPDWLMTSLLIVSFYFLIRDNGKFKIDYWTSLLVFAYALAVKLHSLQYIAVIGMYVMVYANGKNYLKIILSSAAVVIVGFFLFNPKLLSISELFNAYSGFMFEMEGNAKGYGAARDLKISFLDRIATLNFYYLHSILLVGFCLAHIYLIIIGLKNKLYRVWLVMAAGNTIVIIFNLFFVSKNWQNYYHTFMIFGFVLLLVAIVIIIKPINYRWNGLILFLGITMVLTTFTSFKAVSQDYRIAEIGGLKIVKGQIQTWKSIKDLLENDNKPQITILKSFEVAFDIFDIDEGKNINVKNIGTRDYSEIYTNPINFLNQNNYVILRKYDLNNPKIKINEEIIRTLNKLNSELVFENELIFAYKIKN